MHPSNLPPVPIVPSISGIADSQTLRTALATGTNTIILD